MRNFRITNKELKNRVGLLMAGFFAWFYILGPAKEWLDSVLTVNPYFIGIGGLLLTLYFFDL